MNKKLIDAIKSERTGTPVWLPDLRKRVSMSKAAFDAAVMALSRSGKYFLNRHFHPEQATEHDKAEFIPDGQGNYYITINPRSAADVPKTVGAEVTGSSDPVIKKDTALPPERIGRGGSREGAGRPMKKTKVKRVPLQGARIPGWLMDWLRAEGDVGRKIETALIAHYKLTPPEK